MSMTVNPKSRSTGPQRSWRRLVVVSAVPLAVVAGVAGAATTPALAATSPRLIHGTCSAHSLMTLQLQHSDPGIIEVGFQLDRAPARSKWTVDLRHNGRSYFTATRPVAVDRSLSVDRRLPDLSGTDVLVGRSRNAATGETCIVTGRI